MVIKTFFKPIFSPLATFFVSSFWGRAIFFAGLTKSYANATLMLEHLPGTLIGKILSYLMPCDIRSALYLNSHFYQELKLTNTLDYLEQRQQLKKFCYLVAIEGEENQQKAEAMLIKAQSPQRRAILLLERTTIQDAAGRLFKEMSAYAYAFWSGDTRMRNMMMQYMDEIAKAKAYEECRAIVDTGIHFSFQGKIITQSRHFDFQPLLKAYQDYAVALTESELGNWLMHNSMHFNTLVLNIGQEQAKVPIHIAQEYCSNRPFQPLPTFQQSDDLQRTVQFFNSFTNKLESWFFSGTIDVIIYKGEGSYARGAGGYYFDASSAVLDAIALNQLDQARTGADLTQTLEELKPVAQRLQFIP